MRWIVGIGGSCTILLMLLFFAAEVVSHAILSPVASSLSPDGRDTMVVEAYAWMPFRIDGGGRRPGEVRVVNQHGIVVDSDQVPDVYAVRFVEWSHDAAHFMYFEDGKAFEGSLNLSP